MAIYSHFIATRRDSGVTFRKPFTEGHVASLYGGGWDRERGDIPITVAHDTAHQLIDRWTNEYWSYTLEEAK